jgi:superfamily I DNA/RNA helicase
VEAPAEGRLLVLAGPGTGKTEVAAQRLVHLLGLGLGPAQILVLSFSRSAARTLLRRIERLPGLGPVAAEQIRHLSVRTFDSWSFRQLRLLGHPPGDLLRNRYEANIALLLEELRDRRKECAQLLGGTRHVIVDEFQDLAGVRGALVLELLEIVCPPKGKREAGFTVLGDEAQAIYGFAAAGSDYEEFTPPRLFRAIRERYGRSLSEVVLEKNYRAVEKLGSFAEALRRILMRDIEPAKKKDAMLKVLAKVPEVDDKLTADYLTKVGEETAAVLTRTNGEAIRIAQLIWGRDCEGPAIGVELQTMSQATSQPGWVGAALGPLQDASVTRSAFARIHRHLWKNKTSRDAVGAPDEETAWARLCNAVGEPVTATVVDLGKLRERLSWPDLFPDDAGTVEPSLRVMTIHQSKGMEFDNVAVVEHQPNGSANGNGNGCRNGDDASDANVIFVAVTRAGKTIKRVSSGTGYSRLYLKHLNGRSRWLSWNNGWVNMEAGIAGDVSAESFASVNLHGSDAAVDELQTLLATQASSLVGRKVMLCKRAGQNNRHQVYGIHLQEGDQPGLLLGSTTSQVTEDLLKLLWDRGYALPQKMFNLRIVNVVSLGMIEPPPGIAPRHATSGLWIGVQVYGTADFKPFRRN